MIAITSPTTSSTYRTRTSVLTTRGTGSDDVRVTQVRWARDLHHHPTLTDARWNRVGYRRGDAGQVGEQSGW